MDNKNKQDYIMPSPNIIEIRTENYYVSMRMYVVGDSIVIPLENGDLIKIPATALMHGKIEDCRNKETLPKPENE
jgi:hypothetical protein